MESLILHIYLLPTDEGFIIQKKEDKKYSCNSVIVYRSFFGSAFLLSCLLTGNPDKKKKILFNTNRWIITLRVCILLYPLTFFQKMRANLCGFNGWWVLVKYNLSVSFRLVQYFFFRIWLHSWIVVFVNGCYICLAMENSLNLIFLLEWSEEEPVAGQLGEEEDLEVKEAVEPAHLNKSLLVLYIYFFIMQLSYIRFINL